MSFFHLKYANAESQILNLDVRSSILCDYFHKVILSRATEYVHTKSSTVMEGIEETKLNLTHLKDTIASIGVTALNVNSDDGTAIDGKLAVPTADREEKAISLETMDDLKNKVSQLEEMLKTLEYQQTALIEAKEKVDGVELNEIDVCDDTGTPLGLTNLGSTSASDVLESRATYTLCRKTNDKVIMISFAVPPDGSINLDELLGPTRIKVSKKTKKSGSHRRSISERPKGTKHSGKGLKDVTNTHRRSQTSAV
jgi:hypothetical protein